MEQMELYWAISYYACVEIQTLAIGYVLYRFAVPFMENRKGAFAIGLAYFTGMLAVLPFDVNNFVAYGIGHLAAFAVMCRIDRRNYRQKVFLIITFFSLRWLSVYMAMNLIADLYDWTVENAYLIQHPALQLAAYTGVQVFDRATGIAVMGLGVRHIVRAYVYKHENMSVKEMLMLCVPSVTGMLGYGMMQYYNNYYGHTVFEATAGIYKGVALLYYAVSILSIVVMTVMFQNIKARQEEELQNGLLAAQVDGIRQQMAQVESLYQDIRSLRHDMANHILTLERLYGANAPEEARAYAADLKAALAEASGEIKTGNPVTDVILRGWKKEAEKKAVRFQPDFHYPAGPAINAFDISVILNNALQNAMEHAASSAKPYISIFSYCRGNAYMIEIKNSFAGVLKWDTESGLPLSAKEKTQGHAGGKAHGYGLANIRKVAQKYYGDIAVEQTDGEFQLSILLMTE